MQSTDQSVVPAAEAFSFDSRADAPTPENAARTSAARRNRRLAWLMLAALLVRLVYAAGTTGLGRSMGDRYQEYLVSAARLLDQGTLVSPFILERTPTEPSALLPPVYAWIVAGAFALFGVETPLSFFVLQLLQAIGTSVIVWFVFRTAEMIAGATAGWIAAAVAVVHPALFGFVTYFWDTSLFTLGVAVAVWMAATLGRRHRKPRHWIGFGLYLGFLALLNPALTTAYPFLVLWPLTRQQGRRFRPLAGGVTLVVIGWLLAITPWTVRNWVHFQEIFYIRNGFMNDLWIGVCPEADTNPPLAFYGRFPLLNDDVQRHISEIGEQAYLAECAENARRAIAEDPLRYVKLISIRIVDYWAGTLFGRTWSHWTGFPPSLERFLVMLILAFEAAALIACVIRRNRLPDEVRWLVGAALIFSLVYCLTHVQVRFRAPSEPILIIMTAVLVSRYLPQRLRDRIST